MNANSRLGEIRETRRDQRVLSQVGWRLFSIDEYLRFDHGQTKNVKMFPLTNAEGWCDRYLHPVIVWLQYTVCYIAVVVYSSRSVTFSQECSVLGIKGSFLLSFS
jgi:hypothetical protein